MAPVPWRVRVWWQALHPPVMKTSTPFERLSSRSAPGPNRALARHATNTERTTRPNTRKKHAKPQRPPDPTAGLPPLNLNAAGIDVGSAEPDVAVPPDRSPEPVRRLASCTADLQAWADWLQACHIDTVVMERTGVYWSPLFQILEARGLAVHLVNARHAKNLPGRNTDIADGQWLQKLHTCGLLNSAFRPTDDICVRRSYLRQRDTLISAAATGIQHRQKALTELNIQLAQVISDSSGVTGLAILRALLAGARDPAKLAALKDDRINARTHPLANSLEGHWRAEWLLNRRQSLELYECDQQNIAACDTPIEAHLLTFDSTIEGSAPPLPTPQPRPKKARRHEPHVDLHTQRSRISGVDLTRIDGLEGLTAPTLIAELGLDMSRWKTEKHFASWLGFCPDNRISGGNGLTRGTRDVVTRAADALRLAAQHLLHRNSALGANYRRLRARLGAPKAITAMAHKLARLVYRMRKFGQQDVDNGLEQYEARFRQPRLQWLQRQARELTLQRVPNQPVPSAVS
jgi:transposase